MEISKYILDLSDQMRVEKLNGTQFDMPSSNMKVTDFMPFVSMSNQK